MPKRIPLLIGAAALLGGVFEAFAVNVWVTSGDRSRLFAQQPDVAFGATGGGVAITVDASQRFQSMDGYGAAMTNSSAWLLQNRMDPTQRDRLMRDLFSTSDGAGLNQLRVVIGASDFTADGFYTYNDLPPGQTDPGQANFSIDPDRATILPSLDAARAANPNLRLMGSPWSAPGWMKTSGSVIGGSLRPEFRASYAIYLQRFIEAYAAEGHPIDTLTLQNEPLFTGSNYPGMLMSAAEQIDLLKNHVGPRFERAGIETEIFAYDHNWDEPGYPIEVLNDPDARRYVAGSAFHGYAGDVSAQTTVRNAHPDKKIWFTELSGGDFAPNFEDNLFFYAQNLLIGGARNWSSAAMMWNLALDENSGPRQGGCPNCRGVVTIDSGSGQVTYNEEFYALAHAGRFVQPGAVRIASTSIGNQLETVAFENPDGSRTMLALNVTQSTQAFRVFENGQNFRYEAPARSLMTFTWTPDDRADFDNGGFESGGFDTTGGSLDGWLAWGVTGDNVTVSDAQALEGVHALRLAEPGQPRSFSGVSQGVTVQEGDRLIFDAHVLLPTAGSLAGTRNVLSMRVEFYDTYGGQFQSTGFLEQTQQTVADGATGVGNWNAHQIDTVAPAGAVEARLVFAYAQPGNEPGTVFVDDVRLRVIGTLAGDFNGDGRIDAADFTIWRDQLGETGPSLAADADRNGVVDRRDYDLWSEGYGRQTSETTPVPEPRSAALLLLGGLGTRFSASRGTA